MRPQDMPAPIRERFQAITAADVADDPIVATAKSRADMAAARQREAREGLAIAESRLEAITGYIGQLRERLSRIDDERPQLAHAIAAGLADDDFDRRAQQVRADAARRIELQELAQQSAASSVTAAKTLHRGALRESNKAGYELAEAVESARFRAAILTVETKRGRRACRQRDHRAAVHQGLALEKPVAREDRFQLPRRPP